MDEPFELSFTENFPYHSIGFRADSCAYVVNRLPKKTKTGYTYKHLWLYFETKMFEN